MGRMSTLKYGVIILLVIGVAALSVELFYTYLAALLLEPEPVTITVTGQENGLQTLVAQGEVLNRDFDLIVTRNIFGVSRDSPLPDQTLSTGNNAEHIIALYALKGTITIDSTDTRRGKRAVLANRKSGVQKFYRIGDPLDAAVITEITRRYVVIEYNGRRQILYQQPPQQAPTASVVPAAKMVTGVEIPAVKQAAAEPRAVFETTEPIPEDGVPRIAGRQNGAAQQFVDPVEFRGKVIVE